MAEARKNNQTGAFALITSLFFMWGFLTSMNDVLIPFLKGAFDLTHTKAVLVQTAFFGAYFIGSLIYFLLSVGSGDPILKIGYKNGVIGGLVISTIGAALFYPAATYVSYPFFLAALFVLGLGFTLLQISANPYVTLLGSEKTASSRLNLSQGFNSLGTTLAPLIGGYLIFKYAVSQNLEGPDAVIVPYLIFAGMLALLTLFIIFAPLPSVVQQEEKLQSNFGVLKYPQVWLGMAAIFFYVGAEVSVGSFLIQLFGEPEMGGMDEDAASVFVAIYWGGLMIGRFMGAISLSEMKDFVSKIGLMAVAAVGCFLVILLAVSIKSGFFALSEIWPFTLIVLLSFGAFLLGKALPARTLGIFSLISILLLVVTVFTDGELAKWSVVGVGIFNSIMWSNIFAITLDGLGKYKSQASSLLVMMIIGGALYPLVQGNIAELYSVHASYWVPVIGYVYLAFYGFMGPRISKGNAK